MVANNITGKLNNGYLHTQTETQEGNIAGTGVMNSFYLSIDAAMAKASGNQDAVRIPQEFFRVFAGDGFRIYPLDIDGRAAEDAAVF